jgi:hypothetical protein
MHAHNDSPSPEWYEPADIIDDDEPTPINRPTVSLTERGARLLALLACQERLPVTSPELSAVLDRHIGRLLDS